MPTACDPWQSVTPWQSDDQKYFLLHFGGDNGLRKFPMTLMFVALVIVVIVPVIGDFVQLGARQGPRSVHGSEAYVLQRK